MLNTRLFSIGRIRRRTLYISLVLLNTKRELYIVDIGTCVRCSCADLENATVTTDLLSFYINSDAFQQGTGLESSGSLDEDVCALPQTAYIVYRDAKLFHDPSLSADGKQLASGVISAQVGVSAITNLDGGVRGTFKVHKNISENTVGNLAEASFPRCYHAPLPVKIHSMALLTSGYLA